MLAGQWRIEIFELVVFNILKKRVGGAQLEPHSLPNQSLTFLMRFYLHTITHSTGLAQHCLISLLGRIDQLCCVDCVPACDDESSRLVIIISHIIPTQTATIIETNKRQSEAGCCCSDLTIIICTLDTVSHPWWPWYSSCGHPSPLVTSTPGINHSRPWTRNVPHKEPENTEDDQHCNDNMLWLTN